MFLVLSREVTLTSVRMWFLSEPWEIPTCQSSLLTMLCCLGKLRTHFEWTDIKILHQTTNTFQWEKGVFFMLLHGKTNIFHFMCVYTVCVYLLCLPPPVVSYQTSSLVCVFLSMTMVCYTPPSWSLWLSETCSLWIAWSRRYEGELWCSFFVNLLNHFIIYIFSL